MLLEERPKETHRWFLSELVAAVKAGDGTDLIRELAQWALQQLIDAEAPA